jgi:hypothetical protein
MERCPSYNVTEQGIKYATACYSKVKINILISTSKSKTILRWLYKQATMIGLGESRY